VPESLRYRRLAETYLKDPPLSPAVEVGGS
jgi:hypothetical protein